MEYRTPLAEDQFRRFVALVESSSGHLCGHDMVALRGAFYAGLFSVFVMMDAGHELSEIRDEFWFWAGVGRGGPRVRQ